MLSERVSYQSGHRLQNSYRYLEHEHKNRAMTSRQEQLLHVFTWKISSISLANIEGVLESGYFKSGSTPTEAPRICILDSFLLLFVAASPFWSAGATLLAATSLAVTCGYPTCHTGRKLVSSTYQLSLIDVR